jgi:hypothetical protein
VLTREPGLEPNEIQPTRHVGAAVDRSDDGPGSNPGAVVAVGREQRQIRPVRKRIRRMMRIIPSPPLG